MSLAREIIDRALRALCESLALREDQRDNGVYKVLRSPILPDFSGALRVFRGEGPVERMVSTSLVIPSRGHQTHMVFCFGAANSLIPHFTIDSSDHGQGRYAFHLDLIPRLELGAHIDLMRSTYSPLTAVFNHVRDIEGVGPVIMTPEHRSVMSPWMLVHTCTGDAFLRCEQEVMNPYREHFLRLCKDPPSGPAPDPVRDRATRRALFDPSVDPVWGRVERMLGAETTLLMRGLLDGSRSL